MWLLVLIPLFVGGPDTPSFDEMKSKEQCIKIAKKFEKKYYKSYCIQGIEIK